MTVYNKNTNLKEEMNMPENTKATREIVDNPEPDWSIAMFWEDITAILLKLVELIKSFFNY